LFADKQSTDHIERIRDVSRTRMIVTIGAGLVVGFSSSTRLCQSAQSS
jgi:hypothetical protein